MARRNHLKRFDARRCPELPDAAVMCNLASDAPGQAA